MTGKYDIEILKDKSTNDKDIDKPFSNIERTIEKTELGEALDQLNSDEQEKDSNLSKIDMRTRLRPRDISLIMAWDTLVAIGFLPPQCLVLTRTKKRLAVSLGGQGRKEIVEVVGGKKEYDTKARSLMGGVADFFKREN